ncbi:MAG: aminotransferase class V-fold PLP-dependent enzyme [Candidatus Dependentiae bacterium]|jgi:cysteine desulfurase/selenocysteine lyase
MNTKELRQHFPSVSASPKCRYLDNAATACMPACVRTAIHDFYGSLHGSVHRGVYESAEHTTSAYEHVRAQTADFVGATSADEIIFTSGATDSLNMVAHTWAYHNLTYGDAIVITAAEHHSNYVLWQEVARRTGAQLRTLPINPQTFTVDLSLLPTVLDDRVKLVALTVDSNVLGPIWGANDEILHDVLAFAQKNNVCTVLDVAQRVAHAPLQLGNSVDFAAFSAHKMGGPTGLGVLYANKRRHEQMRPHRLGGGMVHSVSEESYVPQQPPHCFEAGTPPLAQVIGFGALLNFYTKHVDWAALKQHEAALSAQLTAGLKDMGGVTVVGNADLLAAEGHLVSWYVEDMHGHDLAAALSLHGCMVRAGDHCAQPLSRLWDNRATVRASFMMYNTAEEVAHLVKSMRAVLADWRGTK